jgi:hypothetical protein
MDHWLLDHDLSVFTLYPNFVKLNAAEMALLCGRGMASTSRLAETLRSRVECAPSGAEAFDRLFRQAIAASALDTEGSAALEAVEAATRAVSRKKKSMKMERRSSLRDDASSDSDSDDQGRVRCASRERERDDGGGGDDDECDEDCEEKDAPPVRRSRVKQTARKSTGGKAPRRQLRQCTPCCVHLTSAT